MTNTRRTRRPDQNYIEMGLNIGDRLIFKGLEQEIVTVSSDRMLEWQGKPIALTPLRKEFQKEFGWKHSKGSIRTSDDVGLDDLYDATYPVDRQGNKFALVSGDADQGTFVPQDVIDARISVNRAIKVRRGQKAFRDALMKAYGGRCAMTGCSVQDVLEAAHITPYLGQATNHISNGILLRADIHTLFDCNLIAVHPTELTVDIHEKVLDADYRNLHGRTLLLPKNAADRPEPAAILQHWHSCGLRSP